MFSSHAGITSDGMSKESFAKRGCLRLLGFQKGLPWVSGLGYEGCEGLSAVELSLEQLPGSGRFGRVLWDLK